jgi:hypothetical protein
MSGPVLSLEQQRRPSHVVAERAMPWKDRVPPVFVG